MPRSTGIDPARTPSVSETVAREREYWEAHEDLDWASEASKAEVVALLPPYTGDVLELCVGSGTFTRSIPPVSVSYIGVDLAGSLLRTLQRRVPRAVAVQGNAQELAFADRSFDAVLVFAGLHHLPSYDLSIREAYRVLRPGGSFFCFEPNDRAWYRLFTRLLRSVIGFYSEDEVCLDAGEIAGLMRQAGFVDLKEDYLTPRFRPSHLGWQNKIFAAAMYSAAALGRGSATQSFFALRGRKPADQPG